MNYDTLTMDGAVDELRNHPEADWSDDRLWDEVIEPRDVLYYLDAFGDLSLAINCQGLPKDLPDDVIREVNEYDVLNDWAGKVSELDCPLCNRTLYEFDWKYDCLYIDEYGDEHNALEYIEDHAGYYWDATGEHKVMCQSCHEHTFSGWGPEPSSNNVRFFYGENNLFSRFSHEAGIIRWDFMFDSNHNNSIDVWNVRGEDGERVKGYELAAAFAKGDSERDEMMERIGFKKIHVKEIEQSVKGSRRFWRYANEVLKEWATLDATSIVNGPTEPELDFTYIIEGEFQAWIPEEHFEEFRAELIRQALLKA